MITFVDSSLTELKVNHEREHTVAFAHENDSNDELAASCIVVSSIGKEGAIKCYLSIACALGKNDEAGSRRQCH